MSAAPTPSQTIGPFFRFGMAWLHGRDLVAPDVPGAITVSGRVLDGDGQPVPDAMIEIYQPDALGGYPPEWGGFGRCMTDREGRYRFVTVKPGRPDERQAPHIDVSVFARGVLQRLLTRIYFSDETAANVTDPLLSSVDADQAATLVAAPVGDGVTFDIRLQGEGETAFLAW